MELDDIKECTLFSKKNLLEIFVTPTIFSGI